MQRISHICHHTVVAFLSLGIRTIFQPLHAFLAKQLAHQTYCIGVRQYCLGSCLTDQFRYAFSVNRGPCSKSCIKVSQTVQR